MENTEGAEDAADGERDLAALITASLVEPLQGGRLRLHQVLREYAAHHLEDKAFLPTAVAAQRGDAALTYWLAYAQAHETSSTTLNPVEMDALEAEAPGLLGALR